MDDPSDDYHHFFRPAQSALVSLSPFAPFPASSPAPRRLSSRFVERSQPVAAARKLAWVSLQGRIVGAEEASSARVIGGGLSKDEAVAWEMFTPMHRILVVAVVAVAAAQSTKNREIRRLKQSVDLRDQVMSVMQQKLDNLCEQVNYFKEQPLGGVNMLSMKNAKILSHEASDSENAGASGSNCPGNGRGSLSYACSMGNSSRKGSKEYDLLNNEYPFHVDDLQEERRMSSLSDWASSVTSSSDFQLVSLEQELQNLKQQCQEKDVTIQELSQYLKSVDVYSSKRVMELENVIRRKNNMIGKLRKDMMVLDHKVMHLTRAKRPSTSDSTSSICKFPLMSDNVLYDMDSTTSPSSGSDCSCETKPPTTRNLHTSNKTQVSVTTTSGEHKSEVKSPVKFADHNHSRSSFRQIRKMSMNQIPSKSEKAKAFRCI
uniref:Uncharacterized protein n=1 Tax=Kalanchoe fedtschenkoi TaxID=63787 RepID=A0A7N0TT18_KALFE